MVDLLVSLGADVNICGEGAAIPLHMAAQYGNVSDSPFPSNWLANHLKMDPVDHGAIILSSAFDSSPWSRNLLNLGATWSVPLLFSVPNFEHSTGKL